MCKGRAKEHAGAGRGADEEQLGFSVSVSGEKAGRQASRGAGRGTRLLRVGQQRRRKVKQRAAGQGMLRVGQTAGRAEAGAAGCMRQAGAGLQPGSWPPHPNAICHAKHRHQSPTSPQSLGHGEAHLLHTPYISAH